MEIQKKSTNGILVLSFGREKTGDQVLGEVELDIDNNYILTEVVEEELSKGNIKLILDLKNVSYIDSSGLGSVFDSYKQVEEKGGTLKVLNPTDDVKRVLDITKISKKIEVLFNEEKAIASF